jgi:general secretion pathway protein N
MIFSVRFFFRTCASVVALFAGIGLLDAQSQVPTPGFAGPPATGQRGSRAPDHQQPDRGSSNPPGNQVDRIDPKPASDAINPLWVRPLSSLSPTRDRPIFSRSRRPPLVAAGPKPAPSTLVASPVRPTLTLVGAVAAGPESIAILRDETTQEVLELRTGEGHSGWVLRSVAAREATFQKGADTAILAIPVP